MIQKKISGFLFIIFCLTFLTGTIRKQDDPIRNTQTDPILHKQKMEEIKDGEKGAPTPSWKLYPKEKFLAKSPVENEPNAGTSTSSGRIPNLGEPIPENISEEDENEENWWTENPEEDYPAEESEVTALENEVKKDGQKAETE